MGVVYSARDQRLGRRVALKVLRHWFAATDERACEVLHREALVMARVAHPNVVGIYDLFESNGRSVVAMELVEGTTLRKWLDAAPRPSRDVVSAFALAGRGLAAAHAKGIVHRDFKPENVLVGASGRVCVSDFGLSRAGVDERASVSGGAALARSSALTVTLACAGTPRYMSPEQHRGEPATPASDQFSFCVALYEAL